MNRRAFLAGMLVFLPAGIAAGWWLRVSRAARSLAAAGAPVHSGGANRAVGATAARAVATPGETVAAPPAGAVNAANGLPPLRYGPGLPIRWTRVESLRGACARGLAAARRHILAHCTNLGFANGAIHGVRALGRDLSLGDGDAFRQLLENYTQETAVGGRTFLDVPVHDEGHRYAMLKTLIERQCDFDLEFDKGGRTYRFRDYVDSARLLHTYDLNAQPIDEHSWAIMAFVRVTPSERACWRNVYGHTLDLERMIDDTSEALTRDTQLIRDVDLDQPELPRDCPVYARACGGLHLLYALAAALSSGYANDRRSRDFATHMRTLVRRCRYDLGVIDQVEALNVPRAGKEVAGIEAFGARLKFLGHSLETVGLVDQFRLYEFAPPERAAIDRARAQLCAILAASETMNLGRYRPDRELYESLVGDLCHAYNGLLMSPV